MGKLIVIDGIDGSGKNTQARLLTDKLTKAGVKVCFVEIPDYSSDASALIKMYLGGEFGPSANALDAYQASVLFAVERFASYRTGWKKDYDDNTLILCDRYVTSNMIHQAAKIKDAHLKNKFLDWLWDFEYNIYNMPQPDKVLFLDMPVEFSIELMKNRDNKITGTQKKDVHESDRQYLAESYFNACYVADKYKWERICCVSDGILRSPEDISAELFEIVKGAL